MGDYEGGENTIADCWSLTEQLIGDADPREMTVPSVADPEVVLDDEAFLKYVGAKLANLGVCYVRHLRDNRLDKNLVVDGASIDLSAIPSWQDEFKTKDLNEAARKAREARSDIEEVSISDLLQKQQRGINVAAFSPVSATKSERLNVTTVCPGPSNETVGSPTPCIVREYTHRTVFEEHEYYDVKIGSAENRETQKKWTYNSAVLHRHAHLWHSEPSHFVDDKRNDINNQGSQVAHWAQIPTFARPSHVVWGDRSEFSERELRILSKMYQETRFHFQLGAGDLLLLDNQRVKHGRRAFRGTKRVMGILLSGMKDRSNYIRNTNAQMS